MYYSSREKPIYFIRSMRDPALGERFKSLCGDARVLCRPSKCGQINRYHIMMNF